MISQVLVFRVLCGLYSEKIEKNILDKWFSFQNCYVWPVDEHSAIFISWKYVDLTSKSIGSKVDIVEMAIECDEYCQSANIELFSVCGGLGLLRAFDANSTWCIVKSTEEVELAHDIVETSASKDLLGIYNFIAKNGSLRPSPIYPEAAHLLAHADSNRGRPSSVLNYIRIFESAFKEHNEAKLIPRIETFLKTKPWRAEKTEIRKWFNMRGMDAHSPKGLIDFNSKKYDHYLDRIRQSATDVAYNKRDWGDKKSLRTERKKLDAWIDDTGQLHASFDRKSGARIELECRRELLGLIMLSKNFDPERIKHMLEVAKSKCDEISKLHSSSEYIFLKFKNESTQAFDKSSDEKWSDFKPTPALMEWIF